MFTCFVCQSKHIFTSGKALIAHLHFFHAQILNSGSLICTHEDCFSRQFNKFNSFRKHISTHTSIAPSCPIGPRSENVCDKEFVDCTPYNIKNCDSISPDGNSSVSSQEQSVDCLSFDRALCGSVVAYIATLYDIGLTETQVQSVIDSNINLIGNSFIEILEKNVMSLLNKSKSHQEISELDIVNTSLMFDSVKNMFSGFKTAYLRQKEFESCGAYIPPESFTIGSANTEKSEGGQVVHQPIALTGQFIPFRKVLKGFLELDGVLNIILQYMDYLDNSFIKTGKMENVIQGRLWREKIKPKFPGKTLIPLTFSFDDYETNKDLGTHAGVHKLGAGYIRIGCLPPAFLGSLENIFLAVLFHSSDKAFGNRKVFRKVVEELKVLEESGLSISLSDGTRQVYFSLCHVVGDNLGANEILGFVESFSANYFCRICTERKDVTWTQTLCNPDKIRNPLTYDLDLAANDPSKNGLKGECVFNDLKSFHVFENFHTDSMHDFDEGVWRYVMTAIIKYFVKEKRVSYEYLNELIQGFNYGPNENGNKPPLILHEHLKHSGLIKFSATEMRCFARYFGLMFGHLVKYEDLNVWNLYLTARKILDIITAPCLCADDALELKNLLFLLHSKYIELFQVHLPPKFHLVLHYPDLILENGPPEPLSVMRVEAKHKEGKLVAKVSNNRINLPLTVARRHQLKVAFRFLSGRGLVPKFELAAYQTLKVSNMKNYELFSNILPDDFHELELISVKWARTNGMKYFEESIVVISFENETPEFGMIQSIFVREGKEIFFLLKVLNTVTFNEHLYAYEVVLSDKWLCIPLTSLYTHICSSLHICCDSKQYVAFRCSLKRCK